MRLDDGVTDTPTWSVVLPVKGLSAAKSRMAAVSPAASELAFAFYQDTLNAALASPLVAEVVVATSDERVAAVAIARGCTVVSDADHPGINPAARAAAAERGGAGGVAIVVSDLPALTAAAITSVLTTASGYPTCFLADADGTGTTMWLSSGGAAIDPRFGLASRTAHNEAGAVDLVAAHPEMSGNWAAARRDVDTDAALADAIAMGVGTCTSAAIAPAAERLVTVLARSEDRVDIVDEDGLRGEVAWAPVAAAGLRDLHPGQRIVLTGDGVRLP
jgi:2-phospho-L-lactate guanylyltransferase